MVDRVEIEPEAPQALPPNTEAPPAGEGGGESERPAWLPEKFATPEAFVEAYQNLETRLGSGEEAPATEAGESNAPALSLFEQAVADYEENDGQVSDDMYAKLAEGGFPREVVDAHIAGQQAIADRLTFDVQSAVGGEDGYNRVTAWMSSNLSEAELNAYNQIAASLDGDAIKTQLLGFQARMNAAGDGGDGRQVVGTPSSSNAGYESQAQMLADMQDPQYQTDPAFRARVARRIAASPNL